MVDNQEDAVKQEKVKLPNDGRPYIVASIMEDGSLKVSGFTTDKVLAYGLLASAKDIIQEEHMKQQKIQNVNNSGGLIQMLRGIKR